MAGANPADDQGQSRHAVGGRVGRADDDAIAGKRIVEADREGPGSRCDHELRIDTTALFVRDEHAGAGDSPSPSAGLPASVADRR